METHTRYTITWNSNIPPLTCGERVKEKLSPGPAQHSTARDVQALAPDQELWAQLVSGTEEPLLPLIPPSRKDRVDLLEGGFPIGSRCCKGRTSAFLSMWVPRAPSCTLKVVGEGRPALLGTGQEVGQLAVWHLLWEQERLSCVAQGLCACDYAPLTHQTTARECEGSIPPTRTLSLNESGGAGGTGLRLPSQLRRAARDQLPKPFSDCCVPWEQRGELSREGDCDF